MSEHDAPTPADPQAALRRFRVEQKALMQCRVQDAQQCLRALQQDLRKTIPNADGLILMKDIEKSQRQMEKLLNGVQSLVV